MLCMPAIFCSLSLHDFETGIIVYHGEAFLFHDVSVCLHFSVCVCVFILLCLYFILCAYTKPHDNNDFNTI